MKKCTSCSVEKDPTCFSYRKTNKGRATLRQMCRDCEKTVHGKHR